MFSNLEKFKKILIKKLFSQVVALTHTLLAHDTLTKVHRVLVVCPLSTVLNWVNEFKMWLKFAERESDIDVYELSR